VENRRVTTVPAGLPAGVSVAGMALALCLTVGGACMSIQDARGDDAPAGPRTAAWKAVDKALEEG
jgi:hypothetical protein